MEDANYPDAITEKRQHRSGETHGPCPVTGDGEDCCWWSYTDDGVLLMGCRKCSGGGGGLDRDQFRAHAAALDLTPGKPGGKRRKAPKPKAADLPDILPMVVGEHPAGTPGAAYLKRRGCGAYLPWCARWMSREAAHAAGIVPRCPDSAAGVLVYLFTTPSGKVSAAQIEAVNQDGVRVLFPPTQPDKPWRKRPSVMGSRFGGGLAAFRPALGNGSAAHVCEGPPDALVLAQSAEVGFDAVIGVAGTAMMRPAAVAGYSGSVSIWSDSDEPGEQAANRMARELPGRLVTIRGVEGRDVSEAAVHGSPMDLTRRSG